MRHCSLRRNPNAAASSAGFTLLEVLIAIVILAFIVLATSQSMTQTYRMRDVLIKEGDFYNGIRLSMAILERDYNQLFSPVAYLPPKKTPRRSTGSPFGGAPQPEEPPTSAADAQQAAEMAKLTDFWLPATTKAGVRLSRFVGEENKFTFITASHQRLYKDRPESEFAKVTYELREEKDEESTLSGTRTLVKIVDTNVFDDEERKDTWRRVYYILPGVKKFEVQYFRNDKRSWERKWDNGKTDDLNGKYPDLVQIKLEVTGGARLNFDGTYIIKAGLPIYGLDKTY